MLIAEQIERAQAETEGSGSKEPSPPAELGLKRDDPSEKVVLSLAPKAPSPSTAPSGGLKLNALKPTNPLKLSANPLKTNPLKKTNVFKQAAASSHSSTSTEVEQTAGKKREAPASAAERLMFEDQERKRRRMERDAVVA